MFDKELKDTIVKGDKRIKDENSCKRINIIIKINQFFSKSNKIKIIKVILNQPGFTGLIELTVIRGRATVLQPPGIINPPEFLLK